MDYKKFLVHMSRDTNVIFFYSYQLLLYQYRGSPQYTTFGSWKKCCNVKQCNVNHYLIIEFSWNSAIWNILDNLKMVQ